MEIHVHDVHVYMSSTIFHIMFEKLFVKSALLFLTRFYVMKMTLFVIFLRRLTKRYYWAVLSFLFTQQNDIFIRKGVKFCHFTHFILIFYAFR